MGGMNTSGTSLFNNNKRTTNYDPLSGSTYETGDSTPFWNSNNLSNNLSNLLQTIGSNPTIGAVPQTSPAELAARRQMMANANAGIGPYRYTSEASLDPSGGTQSPAPPDYIEKPVPTYTTDLTSGVTPNAAKSGNPWVGNWNYYPDASKYKYDNAAAPAGYHWVYNSETGERQAMRTGPSKITDIPSWLAQGPANQVSNDQLYLTSDKLRNDYNSYFGNTKAGATQNWAGGTLTMGNNGIASYVSPSGQTIRFGASTPLSQIASASPDIAALWRRTYNS